VDNVNAGISYRHQLTLAVVEVPLRCSAALDVLFQDATINEKVDRFEDTGLCEATGVVTLWRFESESAAVRDRGKLSSGSGRGRKGRK
jgi:hypothetical protein